MSATCLTPVRPHIIARELPPWRTTIYAAERVVTIAALVPLAPVLALLAAVIWIVSRRPPLIAHLRAGQDGRPLWVMKFRTMWGAEDGARNPRLIEYISERACPVKMAADPRVSSRLARFMRRYSVDELPQLIHIARGEMSLVGPRPITAAELDEYYGDYAAEVLSARPGLTGLWQIMGRNRLTYRQRLRLDLFLVRRCCIRLYLRILWRTIPRVLTAKDAW